MHNFLIFAAFLRKNRRISNRFARRFVAGCKPAASGRPYGCGSGMGAREGQDPPLQCAKEDTGGDCTPRVLPRTARLAMACVLVGCGGSSKKDRPGGRSLQMQGKDGGRSMIAPTGAVPSLSVLLTALPRGAPSGRPMAVPTGVKFPFTRLTAVAPAGGDRLPSGRNN